MKKLSKRNIIIIAILSLFALSIVTADLLMYNSSLKETGTGRGFSRYWRKDM